MKKKAGQKKELGQSLFEVVVALGFIALIITSVVSLARFSLRNSEFAKNNALATKYAQGATEELRQMRDEDWDTFLIYASGTKSMPVPGGVFEREVVFSNKTADSVQADVLVKWTDGQGDHEIRNITIFTNWQNN